MNTNSRSSRVNGTEIRRLRIARGWTQKQLAQVTGYSERWIRKAESGGSLNTSAINVLAIAFSTPSEITTPAQLTIDHLSITRKWVDGFNRYGREMLDHILSFVANEIELHCPGEFNSAPFVGTFKGKSGLQRWLDLYFSAFNRCPDIQVHYAVGVSDPFVIARWTESGSRGSKPICPIRVNMVVRFKGDLIARIDYDSDTLATHRNFSAA